MLLLGDLEERDIVKEKLRKTVRRQMKKFTAGTVKKHFFQRLDLAANANTFHDLNLLHSVFWLRRSVALPHRHSDLLSLSYPTKPEILEERCGINCIFLHLSLYRKSTVLRFFGSHFPCFSFVKERKNPPEKSGENEKIMNTGEYTQNSPKNWKYRWRKSWNAREKPPFGGFSLFSFRISRQVGGCTV